MARPCQSAATNSASIVAGGGHPEQAIAIYEGDFCYSLPASQANRRSQNQEEKMKTSSNALPRTRSKPATPRARPTLRAVPSFGDCPREQMIAEAAYFRAEQRGFAPGNEMSDWLEAESDIERVLGDRQ